MAYFSKFKIGSTSYDVKDAAAGKSLDISGNSLTLKNAAGSTVSTVTLPSSTSTITGIIDYGTTDTTKYPQLFNHTALSTSDFNTFAVDSDGQYVAMNLSDVIDRMLNHLPTKFHFTPASSIAATVAQSEIYFTLQSINRDTTGGNDNDIAIFESDVIGSDIYQIVITIDDHSHNIISCYGEKVTLGGGGGGSALHTLSIYKNGDEIAFTHLAQSDTVELYDISTSPSLTLDNTGLTNIIKASPVVVKDDTYYGYISSWNTAYKELSIIYANSTQMYSLTLTHQWNNNWQVTDNKRLMTQ